MQGSLLTIGDELLIGQVVNSNASWMSEKLTEINCTVRQHLTVGDRKEEISKALDYLLEKSNFIIIGGGLGPTHDDLTMEVLSDYFQLPLFYDEEWINKETITNYNDISTFYFNGTLRVYGENDLTTAFKEGGRDENGIYRIREFSIKSKNGKLSWSSYSCEASND